MAKDNMVKRGHRRRKEELEAFPKFEELAGLLPKCVRGQVREIMQLLDDEWRDEMCEESIHYARTGRYRAYEDSLVMAGVLGHIIRLIKCGRARETLLIIR